eukprot:1512803-Rhodomonas_salina.5
MHEHAHNRKSNTGHHLLSVTCVLGSCGFGGKLTDPASDVERAVRNPGRETPCGVSAGQASHRTCAQNDPPQNRMQDTRQRIPRSRKADPGLFLISGFVVGGGFYRRRH